MLAELVEERFDASLERLAGGAGRESEADVEALTPALFGFGEEESGEVTEGAGGVFQFL